MNSKSGANNHFSTLTELLEATGSRLRIYDMGRRIEKIDREQFMQFERNETTWPAPLSRHAWIALALEDNASAEPVIWFLKLPLDEQGKLVLAARDYIVQRLAEAWALNKASDTQTVADALKDNPFVFKPREDRMAAFHARVSVDLKRPASSYYAHAQDYFDGKPGWHQWQFVGYQGIADLAARFDLDNNTNRLATAIPQLPAEPMVALCHCLENEKITHHLAAPLMHRLQAELARSPLNLALITALVRGLSRTSSSTHLQQMFTLVIGNKAAAHQIDMLAAIAGRAWQQLEDSASAILFLQALAKNSAGESAFITIMKDLLAIPSLRKPLLAAAEEAEIDEKMQALHRSLRDERNPETSST